MFGFIEQCNLVVFCLEFDVDCVCGGVRVFRELMVRGSILVDRFVQS